MNNNKYTYNIRSHRLGVLAYECAFWLLFFVFCWIVGFFQNDQSDKLIFENKEAFFLLIILPFIYLVHENSLVKRNRMIETIVSYVNQGVMFNPINNRLTFLRYIFFRNVLVFIILSMTNPLLGKMKQEVETSNSELVICLDVSNSMNTKDIDGSSRLEVSKRALVQLVNKLNGHRVGICLFAGNAFVQLPLTHDYFAVKLFLQETESDMISSQGTNISEALSVSNGMFTKINSAKGILLITDGEDHVGVNDSLFKIMDDKKIEVSILGVGTEKGGVVPVDVKKPGLGNKKDMNGKEVISKLNLEFIKNLAEELNASSSVTSQPYPDVSEVLTEINQMSSPNSRNLEIEINKSWYQIFLFLALTSYVIFVILPLLFAQYESRA
jgi:Ca-activated chloride channel family protein